MIFTTTKDSLVDVMGVVGRGMSTSRALIPSAQGVLVEANGDKLILSANNLEMGIRGVVEDVEVYEEGSYVLPDRFLVALKKLPDQRVEVRDVTVDGGIKIEMSSGKSKYTFYPMPAEEFPALYQEGVIRNGNKVTFSSRDIKEMVSMVSFAVSKDENRPVFTGVVLTVEESGNLYCIASDTYRISRYRKTVEGISPFKALIPGKNLVELAKVLDDNDVPVECYFEHQQAVFMFGDRYLFSSRLIEGNFPEVNSVYPAAYASKVKVDRQLLESLLERAIVMAVAGKPKAHINVSGGALEIVVQEDTGAFCESIEAEHVGEDVNNAIFNIRYIAEPLKVIRAREVEMEFNRAMGPCVIRWHEEGFEFSYLALPIKTA